MPEVRDEPTIVEFNWGPLKIVQKGPVTILHHPTYGRTFLIDVTDVDDPSSADPHDPSSKPEKVSSLMQKFISDPRYLDKFSANNGVVALITDKLNSKHDIRIYIGLETSDSDDPEARELVSYSLHDAGVDLRKFYVPFSFDSDYVREYMTRLLKDVSGLVGEDEVKRLTS